MRVDTAIVPAAEAAGLADEIASLWPVDEEGTALDLAIMAGLVNQDTDRVVVNTGLRVQVHPCG
jgi:hypothetical protein